MWKFIRLPVMDKAEVLNPMSEPLPAWNAGLSVGKKWPFTVDQVQKLFHLLGDDGKTREEAMLTIGIDSLLRASDLLSLKVSSVQDSKGEVRKRIQVKQQKTDFRVVCSIGPIARKAALKWIESENLNSTDYLFPGRQRDRPLCRRHFQDIVKSWTRRLGLPEENYGTHSLRRTKAILIFNKTLDPEKVRILLGHSSLSATQEYLGVTEQDALKVAESIQVF